MPDPAYNEESGIWKKGDPGVHTKDGDFETQVLMWTIHLGQYEKTVDQLVQEAIANDCDFIAFTNLDGIEFPVTFDLIFKRSVFPLGR
jgi:hypothetical protein